MTGLLLVVCSMMLARRLQTHDYQSWSSKVEPGDRRVLLSGVENKQRADP